MGWKVMSKKRVAVITNCTSSGSLPVIPYLDGVALGGGFTHSAAAEEWLARVRRSEKENPEGRCTVRQMYTGMSFRSVLQVMDSLEGAKDHVEEADLYIVSLGFGFVKENDVISSYNINIQPPEESPSSLSHIVTAEKFESLRWWNAINRTLYNREAPIADLIARREYDIILVALSNSFLQLVAADVASVSQIDGFQRLRILGPKGSNWMLKYIRHIAKRDVIMPYSPKLNDMIPGNRNDYPQRATLHFIKEILAPSGFEGSVQDHRQKVTDLMLPRLQTFGAQSDDHIITDFITQQREAGITSISAAYTRAVAQFSFPIRFDKFERAWGMTSQKEPTTSELDDAMEALTSIGIANEYDSQEEVISALKLFTQALRSRGGGKFTAGDVITWSKLYFDKRQKPIPETLTNPSKLGRLISMISDDLMLIKNQNAIGGKYYEARP